jgi:hypothetical protein
MFSFVIFVAFCWLFFSRDCRRENQPDSDFHDAEIPCNLPPPMSQEKV